MCPYPLLKREKVLMNMDLFKKIIDDAASSGITEIGLNYFSESLLDPLLFERIKYIKSKGGLKVSFSSNGTLLTKDKVDALLDSGLDAIVFSFDGVTKEVYESIRVGANFEKTKENIIRLVKERNRRGLQKPSISLAVLIQKANYQEIEQFKSFWQELPIKVCFSEVINRTGADLLPEELKARLKPRPAYPCRRIFEVIAVMSNGKVVLCCGDYTGSIILGDLNKQTIPEVWDSNKFKKIREIHLNGQGDKIRLCRDTRCPFIYADGPFKWWGSFNYAEDSPSNAVKV
jgi:MoaA/NifB/PqqE/SkfB family radical SAM enzyme